MVNVLGHTWSETERLAREKARKSAKGNGRKEAQKRENLLAAKERKVRKGRTPIWRADSRAFHFPFFIG
jgi:hypothetical protein